MTTTLNSLRLPGAAAIALLSVAGLTACGADDSAGSGTSSTTSSTTTTPATPPSSSAMSVADLGRTSLTITVRSKAGAAATTRTLTCNPAGGTVADPKAACEQLAAAGGPAAFTLDSDKMCTQQIAGTAQATVSGTVGAKQVKAELSQTDGCRTAQWNSLSSLLGSRAGS